jgi:uncharacterized protein (TIGR03435 family)
MAKRATGVGRAVLLVVGVGIGVCQAGTGIALAQAGVEAGMAGAAASSAAGAAGKATGSALGSVLGQTGAKMDSAAGAAASPPKQSLDGAPKDAAGAKPPAATNDFMPTFTSAKPLGDAGDEGVAAGTLPEIHFNAVSFQRCNGGVASTKVELPMDGDYVAYHCQPVFWILHFAYTGTTTSTLTLGGYPDWVETELYNFKARVAPEDVATWHEMSLGARRAALRGLLTEALKLKIHVKTTPKAVYTLQVATDGAKLKAYTEGEQQRLPNGLVLNGRDMSWMGRIAYFQDASMGNLAELLSAHLDRPVLNLTGLSGGYNFSLPLPYGTGTSANVDLGENTPSVAKELSELGLELETGRADVDGLVVDRIQRPAEE